MDRANRRDSATQQKPGAAMTMGVWEWALIVLLSLIWGGSFFFIEVALMEMTPLSIVMYRVAMASVVLLGYVYLSGRKMPSSLGLWGAFLIMAVLNNVLPFSLIVWGQKHIDSSLASILNAMTPVFSVILAHFLTREEPLTLNRGAGVMMGWLGVLVLIGIESLNGFGIDELGQVAILGASLCYAFAAIFGRRFKGLSPLIVSAGMLCCSTVLMIPIATVVEQPWDFSAGAVTWSAMIALSVVSTSLAYIMYFRVLARAGATNALLVTFLVPIGAILLGVLVLGEKPGWNAFVGMAIIFAGLIAIDGRLLSRFKRQ